MEVASDPRFVVDRSPPMNKPRPLLGGRYSLERPLRSSQGEQRWMAIESASGRLVVLAIADPGRLSTLSPARGVTHRHLATLIDIVKDISSETFPESVKLPTGAGVAVAEHVPGRTLRAVLEAGPLHAAKAVAWVLRLADALQALHAQGAVHGAVSPRSVIAAPEGRAIAPVLSELIAPPIGAFCPPERLRGAAETASDDVWALYATLYAALTGKPPFAASARDGLLRAMSAKLPPLAGFGVTEPVLQEIIGRGLLAERRGRAADLGELVTALDGWERDPRRMPPPAPPPRPAPRGLGDIVGGTAFASVREDGIVIDDSKLPDDQGVVDAAHRESPVPVAAPPLAGSTAAAVAPAATRAPSATAQGPARPGVPALPKRPSFNPFERRRNLLPWVLVAAVAGGGVVYLALAPGATKSEPRPEPALEAPAAPRVAPKPTAKQSPEAQRDACVVAHFPQDSFDGKPDIAFVCQDGDFRETAARLNAMVLARDPSDAGTGDAGAALPVDIVRAGGGAVDGGARGSRLGWYELPATAIIRKTCCPGASPAVLPETPGWCEQLQSVVRRMADDSAKSVDLAPGARTFDKAVGCLFAGRVRHGYGYDRPPTPANRAIFQQFLSRAAIIGTRR